MRARAFALVIALGAAGCVVPRGDEFSAAQAAMARQDLMGALRAYDAVPVMHPRYPEARAGAAAVELRMRRGHELMLEGLVRRGEWRDAEALASLERALEVWPDMPGAAALIEATRHRLELFAAMGNGSAGSATAVRESLAGSRDARRPDVAAIPRVAALPEVTADEVTAALVGVEARLDRGEFDLAVADLLALAAHRPDDKRVKRRLVPVLLQRALLRYGRGDLTAAIIDLEHLEVIEPGDTAVASLLRSVRQEVASAATPP